MAHTKGPWHVGGKDGTLIYDADGWAIGDTKSYHGRHAEGEAQGNALMMAAASDMLATLIELRAQFDFYASEHRKAGKHEKAGTNEKFAFLASQAINKATVAS